MMRVFHCCLAFAFVVVPAALPTAATARIYDVYDCATPDGERLATRTWRPRQPASSLIDTCGREVARPGFGVTFDSGASNGIPSSWEVKAPADTRIVNFTVHRAARVGRGDGFSYAYGLFVSDDVRSSGRVPGEICNELVNCSERGDPNEPLFSDKNRIEEQDIDADGITALLRCDVEGKSAGHGQCPATEPPAFFAIYRARIGLRDERVPTFEEQPTGTLFDPNAPVQGVRSVRATANDLGGGLHRIELRIDGRTVVSETPVGATDDCQTPFRSLVPCPLHGEVAIDYDTAQLPNGQHQVQVALLDAASNQTLSDPVSSRRGTALSRMGPTRARSCACRARSPGLPRDDDRARLASGGARPSEDP